MIAILERDEKENSGFIYFCIRYLLQVNVETCTPEKNENLAFEIIIRLDFSLLFTRKGFGEKVAPHVPFRSGASVTPSGKRISKECRREEKKSKSCDMAKVSPIQDRRPTPKGIKQSGFITLIPSSLKKRSG